MDVMYIDELKNSINTLMANLESLPVSKSSVDTKYGLPKIKRYNPRYMFHITAKSKSIIRYFDNNEFI